MINSIINKSYKLNKAIEYYYDKSGNIKKTNHFNFNNNGLKQFTYLYENLGDSKFREIDLTNGVVRSIFELNKSLKNFILLLMIKLHMKLKLDMMISIMLYLKDQTSQITTIIIAVREDFLV